LLDALNYELGGELRNSLSVREAWQGSVSLLRGSRPVSVIMDDFDSVLHFEDAPTFLPLLRELVAGPTRDSLTLLILSRRPLERIEAEVRGISTLASLCYPEFVGPVRLDDLHSMWPQAAVYSDSDLLQCLGWSAGYPPLVKYWLSAGADLASSPDGTRQQVEQFAALVEHLDLIGLQDATAQSVLGPIVDDLIRESSQLRALGVLGDEESDGFSRHVVFRDFLRSRTLSLSPWGVLGLAEVELRSIIASVYTEVYGPHWSDAAAESNRPLARCMREAVDKQEKDLAKFGRTGEWLAYTYPKELGDMILAGWNHFSAVFPRGDKRYWGERFSRLAEYRTPVAHNRVEVLSAAQRTQCRVYAEEILGALAAYEDRSRDY
jgi:hypothetical protein